MFEKCNTHLYILNNDYIIYIASVLNLRQVAALQHSSQVISIMTAIYEKNV